MRAVKNMLSFLRSTTKGNSYSGNNRLAKAFKRKRKHIIQTAALRKQFCETDSVSSYPITCRRLRDLALPTPHRLILLSTLYLENSNVKPGHVRKQGLPFYHFNDANTVEFVKTNINPHVTRYECTSPESAYLLQAVFDSFEWRVVLFHAITMDLSNAETVVRINGKEITVEKRAPFKSGLYVDLGQQVEGMVDYLKMTQRKAIADLESIRDGEIDVLLDESHVVFQFKTSTPPVTDAEHVRERYLNNLSQIVYHKLTAGG